MSGAGRRCPHQPVDDAQSQNGGGQGRQGQWRHPFDVEDDQFAGQRHQGDQDQGLHPDDAFPASGHLDDGMLEFHGDQHRHDHSEQAFEAFGAQDVVASQEDGGENLAHQGEQGEHDDDRDDDGDHDRDHLFEAFVEAHHPPLFRGGCEEKVAQAAFRRLVFHFPLPLIFPIG